ncbi:MAG: glycosyltransferase family 39 protein [Burkholderiaceae bacterium]
MKTGTAWHDAGRVGAVAVWGSAVTLLFILFLLFRPEYLNTDTAQYISGARHLLAGEGYSTSVLYFEDQLRFGRIPAPQTTWPPGFSLLIAVSVFLGIPDLYAPFIVAALSAAASILMVHAVIARVVSVGRAPMIGGLLMAVVVFPHVLVFRGLTEPTYTLFTLIALMAIVRLAEGNRHWAVFASLGAACAAAFMTRYMGATFVIAVGLFLLIELWRVPSWKCFWGAGLAMAIPGIIAGLLFIRNWRLVGTLSGGPDIDRGSDWAEVLRSLWWSAKGVIGLRTDSTPVVVFSLAVVAGITLVLLVWWKERGIRSQPARQKRESATAVMVVSALYAFVTIAVLAFLAQRRDAELLSSRYLAPLLPFVICTALVLYEAVRARTKMMSRALAAGGAICLLGLIGLQGMQLIEVRSWFEGNSKYRVMKDALQEHFAGETVGQYLAEHASAHGPILDVDGQLLGLMLERPVIGLSEAAWTWRTWTDDEVLTLIENFDISIVCFFPDLFDPRAQVNAHREFYRNLAAGRLPDWLVPLKQDGRISLYAVKRPGA